MHTYIQGWSGGDNSRGFCLSNVDADLRRGGRGVTPPNVVGFPPCLISGSPEGCAVVSVLVGVSQSSSYVVLCMNLLEYTYRDEAKIRVGA